jgi:hypothetical protein
MATSRIVTYECEECGSEIVVTSLGESRLSPIYCCGVEVAEMSSVAKKPAKPKKKVVKKVAKKRVAAKKKPAPKKKASRR